MKKEIPVADVVVAVVAQIKNITRVSRIAIGERGFLTNLYFQMFLQDFGEEIVTPCQKLEFSLILNNTTIPRFSRKNPICMINVRSRSSTFEHEGRKEPTNVIDCRKIHT